MKQNNERNQRKRLNSLILLVAFTAIMLIVSTYAWFSINKEVSITNLTGTVNVVEGLQISLDGASWSDTLDLSTLDIINNAYTGNTNFKPVELLPVSTTGVVAASSKEIPMYRGENINKVELTNIVATSTTDPDNVDAEKRKTYPGYIAFDVFLMNSNAGTDVPDTEALQLNSNSSLKLLNAGEDGTSGKESSGLQNTVRVAFAKFSKVADVKASGQDVIDATNAADSFIEDVAIWEPNANAHIPNIVNNNNLIMLSETEAAKWSGMTKVDTYYKFEATTPVPTHAIDSSAVSKSIKNIYDWKTTATNDTDNGLTKVQNTVQTNTSDDNTIKSIYNLKSTTNGTTNFEINTNSIVKLRVYVWLEGQDVDCTNYASHGGGIDLNIGFIKGEEGSAVNR